MASSERATKVALCDGQPDSPSDDPAGCQEASRNTKERKEYNKIGSPWMGIPSCLEAGPGREPGADRSSDTCYNMDCTPDTPEEQLLLSRSSDTCYNMDCTPDTPEEQLLLSRRGVRGLLDTSPQAIIFALFQRVDQAVPELAVPAAAAWLLRRTTQLPAWAPLLFRLVAMEENSAAKVGPPALGVLSSSLSLVADLLSMADLFLWLQAAARAKAAAEDETRSEGEATADNVSETESVNNEEDAGVAAAPLEVPAEAEEPTEAEELCEDDANEVAVAIEVTSEEYEPSDGPSGEPAHDSEARDHWQIRAPHRGRSRSRPRRQQVPSTKR
eukprot:s1137_g9.t1